MSNTHNKQWTVFGCCKNAQLGDIPWTFPIQFFRRKRSSDVCQLFPPLDVVYLCQSESGPGKKFFFFFFFENRFLPLIKILFRFPKDFPSLSHIGLGWILWISISAVIFVITWCTYVQCFVFDLKTKFQFHQKIPQISSWNWNITWRNDPKKQIHYFCL
jgi:hypothetical protein